MDMFTHNYEDGYDYINTEISYIVSRRYVYYFRK